MIRKCVGRRRQEPRDFKCNALVYRCEACGAVGCRNNDCSGQNFAPDGRCMKCGATAMWWSKAFVSG